MCSLRFLYKLGNLSSKILCSCYVLVVTQQQENLKFPWLSIKTSKWTVFEKLVTWYSNIWSNFLLILLRIYIMLNLLLFFTNNSELCRNEWTRLFQDIYAYILFEVPISSAYIESLPILFKMISNFLSTWFETSLVNQLIRAARVFVRKTVFYQFNSTDKHVTN